MRHLCLLTQNIHKRLPRIRIDQTILLPKRNAQRLRHALDIRRHGQQRRMTCIRSIHSPNTAPRLVLLLPMGLQNRVPPAPTKPNTPNLVRAGDHAHGIDKSID